MKVTLKYEEAEDKALHLTLRLTLPAKYVSGPTKNVVKLFVDHYNKKFAENQLDLEAFHLKVVGGEHLQHDALVEEALKTGNECYIMTEWTSPAAPTPAPAAAEAHAVCPKAAAAPKDGYGKSGGANDGKLRCKRFGCNKWYDPNGEPQECVHHKAAPIFHETAKWWSCCPDSKAYDWEGFMRIPGCQKGFCSNTPEGQSQKRFLGGSDLRAEHAPVRLDADAPKDPRHKLADLRKGLVAVGVAEELFDKVWAQLANEVEDPEVIVSKFRSRFAAVLAKAAT
eukprot:TRINITY_DN14286_c0_g1_i1.p1 TRINITY_DN14286_c0_g1~~TRINITY_DN14286_c0_g1_i1.p1  ORF type:complete len:282 (+),score=89.55 TRINITY_DN14286_c0_g1_i1:89-934(+)